MWCPVRYWGALRRLKVRCNPARAIAGGIKHLERGPTGLNRLGGNHPTSEISWRADEAAVAGSLPLSAAEPYGGFLTHPRGHYEGREEWQRHGLGRLARHGLPTAITWHEYENRPRGGASSITSQTSGSSYTPTGGFRLHPTSPRSGSASRSPNSPPRSEARHTTARARAASDPRYPAEESSSCLCSSPLKSSTGPSAPSSASPSAMHWAPPCSSRPRTPERTSPAFSSTWRDGAGVRRRPTLSLWPPFRRSPPTCRPKAAVAFVPCCAGRPAGGATCSNVM
ncbi:hypothetical protein DHODJN_13865 [Methylorubrum extorquens]